MTQNSNVGNIYMSLFGGERKKKSQFWQIMYKIHQRFQSELKKNALSSICKSRFLFQNGGRLKIFGDEMKVHKYFQGLQLYKTRPLKHEPALTLHTKLLSHTQLTWMFGTVMPKCRFIYLGLDEEKVLYSRILPLNVSIATACALLKHFLQKAPDTPVYFTSRYIFKP